MTTEFDHNLSVTWWEHDTTEHFFTDYAPDWFNDPIWARCYCGHRWHIGQCRKRRYMSVSAVGYNRSRQCECEEAKVG